MPEDDPQEQTTDVNIVGNLMEEGENYVVFSKSAPTFLAYRFPKSEIRDIEILEPPEGTDPADHNRVRFTLKTLPHAMCVREELVHTIEILDDLAIEDQVATGERLETLPVRIDLEAVDGIGKVLAARLSAEGVHSLSDLASLTLDEIRLLKVHFGSRLLDWVRDARERIGADVDGTEFVLTRVNGIGKVLSQQLIAEGIEDLNDLASLTKDEIEVLYERFGERCQNWVDAAKEILCDDNTG